MTLTKLVMGGMREAGNPYSSDAHSSTPFTRGSLLYWEFHGWVYFMLSVVRYMIAIIGFESVCRYLCYSILAFKIIYYIVFILIINFDGFRQNFG